MITGLVNQVSGVITNVGNLYFDPFFTQGHGIYNLTGGSLYIGAGGITAFAGGGYEMNLGGGTIGAVVNWSSAVNMALTGINGPVTFNAGGNTITLSGVLSGTGGLTVNGAGVLDLTGANTYTGDTTVTSGSTLQFDTTGTSFGAIKLVTGSTLNLNYSGNRIAAAAYVNGVALAVGTYNSGNLPAYITGSGKLDRPQNAIHRQFGTNAYIHLPKCDRDLQWFHAANLLQWRYAVAPAGERKRPA
ncbi:MAG TPA: autotransporter-associated beta strand repeat-containing protein [Verrucomicrobiae bacterium]|nr:autotransporter-associated beta strand repeat-containing protein [Verrucomicrobiae bacterium]